MVGAVAVGGFVAADFSPTEALPREEEVGAVTLERLAAVSLDRLADLSVAVSLLLSLFMPSAFPTDASE